MSLRARLLIGLVVLTAAGLVAAGIVTYAEERSFLISQVDQELVDNAGSFEDTIDARLGLQKGPGGGGGFFGGPPPGSQNTPTLPGGTWGIYQPTNGPARPVYVPPEL